MGNLGRPGYGASTEGTWPYSYDNCDVGKSLSIHFIDVVVDVWTGTFPNQTRKDGTPTAVATGGNGNDPLSFQPGQRLSACSCPGSDHPGPSTSKGRGAPEVCSFCSSLTF
jgi:beta-glucanase (GH16 family)